MIPESTISETFAKRSAWRVLGVLLEAPFVPHQQQEIAHTLGVSATSVQRGLRALTGPGFAIQKRKQYVISLGNVATKYLWLLHQVDRELSVPVDVRAAIDAVLSRVQLHEATHVLFGSWAQGVASPKESDIDLAIFHGSATSRSERTYVDRFTIDVHYFSISELNNPTTSAALDAVINGVALKNREAVFDSIVRLRTFPKSFLLYRLDQATAQLKRADFLDGSGQEEAAEFFERLANRTVGQIRNILDLGRTRSWRKTPLETSTEQSIHELRVRLAKESDQIWLT
jgi:hypothetical protein